jgi:two-component system, OmpR family, sensor kinase
MTIASLRSRLFVGMTAIILITGAVGGWLSYRWAYAEAIEMQDSVLTQIGSFVQSGAVTGTGPIRGVDADSDITVVRLPKPACGETEECRLGHLPDGLHLARLRGKPVRALITTDPAGSRFAVTQQAALRDEIGGDFAIKSLLPIAALIPFLMLVTALVIARSLRPVVRMAGELDARKADDLSPLPMQSLPTEVAPFVASINRLFARITAMMAHERRFLGEAAHELRSPVTALSLQIENLDQVDLPAAARGRLEVLKAGSRRTKHLLDQLLSLARQDAGRTPALSVVDLASVAKQTVADLLPAAGAKSIDIGFALIETAEIRADPIELATLIRNIVDNAIRFTPHGGRIDAQVHAAGELAIFQLVDTGPGVPAEDLERLFEPFYRGTDPIEDGTGLGLAIVRRIVDNLGGSVALQNRSGSDQTGLYVTVRLPLSRPEI